MVWTWAEEEQYIQCVGQRMLNVERQGRREKGKPKRRFMNVTKEVKLGGWYDRSGCRDRVR